MIRPNNRDDLFIDLLLNIVMQAQEGDCRSNRTRRRLMSSNEHNKHIPDQLLVVQLELGTFFFICPNQ